ncbi:MAG TPA: disulfide oxidoreductase [Candidatus Saccharimonadales bacterium]|nr:disulfide oxidoreductase [Candidatus Saccharimonadales bacterium]
MKAFLKNQLLIIIFFHALIAMVGSLYFSDVLHYIPCVLCWYQRICLYPLVMISGIGYLRNDKNVFWYILPLSVTGLILAIYQNLLYYKIIPESIVPCQNGVSCTTQYINWLGFITIPLLSGITFLSITCCSIIYIMLNKKNEE